MMSLLQMTSLQWLNLQFWTSRSIECLNFTPKPSESALSQWGDCLAHWCHDHSRSQLLLSCFLGFSCCTPPLPCLQHLQLMQYLSQLPWHCDPFWAKGKMCFWLFPGMPFLFWPFYVCLQTASFNQVTSIALYKLGSMQVTQPLAP